MQSYLHYHLVALLLAAARHLNHSALDKLLSYLHGLEETHPLHRGARFYPMELIGYEDEGLVQRIRVRNHDLVFTLDLEDGEWLFEPEVWS